LQQLTQLYETLQNCFLTKSVTQLFQHFTQIQLYITSHNFTQNLHILHNSTKQTDFTILKNTIDNFTILLRSDTQLYNTWLNIKNSTSFYTTKQSLQNFTKLDHTLQTFLIQLYKITTQLYNTIHNSTKKAIQNSTKPDITLQQHTTLLRNFTNLRKTSHNCTNLYKQKTTKLFLSQTYTQLYTTIHKSTKLYKTLQTLQHFTNL
jgi:hypothetical protein